MKRMYMVMLCLLFLLGSLTGCKASDAGTASAGTETTEATSPTSGTVTEIPPEDLEATVPKEGLNPGEGESSLTIGTVGQVRVDYVGNLSSVRYITSVDRLPQYEALQGYDAAYFQEKALLIVMETVTSGSVQVGIQGIDLDGKTATVYLSHEPQGDVGTAVMTTWLIWAEVEAGLEYTWTVGNPAVESQAEYS